MTTTPFPAEVIRLANRNLTREQVLTDMNLVVSQFETTADAIRRLIDVPASTFYNVLSGRQAITSGLLFAMYGDTGNEIRVMGPNGRYIRRSDPPLTIFRGDSAPADGEAFAAIDAARAEVEAATDPAAAVEIDLAPIVEAVALTAACRPAPSDRAGAVAVQPSGVVGKVAGDELEPARALIRARRDDLLSRARAYEDQARRLDDALAILAA